MPPAFTRWPPYTFTPRRCALLSLPFFVDPPAPRRTRLHRQSAKRAGEVCARRARRRRPCSVPRTSLLVCALDQRGRCGARQARRVRRLQPAARQVAAAAPQRQAAEGACQRHLLPSCYCSDFVQPAWCSSPALCPPLRGHIWLCAVPCRCRALRSSGMLLQRPSPRRRLRLDNKEYCVTVLDRNPGCCK